jgi:Mrp family chromosome partitioning ATPase
MDKREELGCEEACGSSEKCSGCSKNPNSEAQSLQVATHAMNHIKKVIAVVSGKGGVGKSMVTGLLATGMRQRGKAVAILDADITGPSIPMMFGVHENAEATELGILPRRSEDGMDLMSVNLLLEQEDQPVIWRGPVVSGVVKQFWTDVIWGNLDVLFIDMPPGTGDVPLTVFQSIPVDGIIVVTSPQELVGMIVKKATNMAKMMNIPILGLVENMSYFKCPDCGKQVPLFGVSHAKQVAIEAGLPLLAQLPMDPDLAQLADTGHIGLAQTEDTLGGALDAVEAILK